MAPDVAYAYLNRDRLHHTDMLEALARGDAELLYAGERGVLILNTACGVYLISAEDEETLGEMCGEIRDPLVLTAHQTRFQSNLAERFGLREKTECSQCSYTRTLGPCLCLPEGVELRLLPESALDFVAEHYTHIPLRSYLEGCLKAGMLGAYVDGRPAGFVGMHDDGSMGLLEILPEYRRRGIAYTLEAAMINRVLARGRIPYAQIIDGNEASLALQRKMGMTFSDKKLVWLYNP